MLPATERVADFHRLVTAHAGHTSTCPPLADSFGNSGIHAAREREAAEQGAGKLLAADEGEGPDTRSGRGAERQKDGRPPCDILVLGIVDK
jgi:hypothetical protein